MTDAEKLKRIGELIAGMVIEGHSLATETMPERVALVGLKPEFDELMDLAIDKTADAGRNVCLSCGGKLIPISFKNHSGFACRNETCSDSIDNWYEWVRKQYEVRFGTDQND